MIKEPEDRNSKSYKLRKQRWQERLKNIFRRRAADMPRIEEATHAPAIRRARQIDNGSLTKANGLAS
jgi:hypothetical protein